jgi:replication factor A2
MTAQTSEGVGQPSLSAYSAAQVHPSGVRDEYSHLPPVPRSIVHFMLNQPQRPEGVHVTAIAKAVGADAESIELDDRPSRSHLVLTVHV